MTHFIGHYGEAATLFTGTCRFDGCVECQQIGLVGNTANYLNDAGDLLGLFVKAFYLFGHMSQFTGNIGDHRDGLGHCAGAVIGGNIGLLGDVMSQLGSGSLRVAALDLGGDVGGEFHYAIGTAVGVVKGG